MKVLPQPCHLPTVVCSICLQADACIVHAILVYVPVLRGVHVYSQRTTHLQLLRYAQTGLVWLQSLQEA